MTLHDEATEPVQRGFAYGTADGAVYGTTDGGSYGPQRSDAYRARIVTDDDQRFDVDAVITADIQLEHTGVSDVRLEIPRIQGLKRFRFGTMDVFFGDRFLFRATLEKFPGPGTEDTAELYGRGPARTLQRRTLSVSFTDTEAWKAIRQVWNRVGFKSTVIEPSTPTTLSDYSKQGTALEVLQDLHERAGMRFTVLHDEPDQVVESYDPSELTKSGSWDAIEHSAEGDVTDYANKVVVFGAKADDGTRVSATAKDDTEIQTVTGGEPEPIRIDDPAIATDADAQARADEELAERLGNDTFSGTLEVVPQLILPGYYRSIPEWDTGNGAPVLSVDSVSLTEGVGGGSASIDVNAPDGLADVVARQQRQITELQQPTDIGEAEETTTETIIDDFEDGDLDGWNTDARFSVVDESNLSFSAIGGSKLVEVAADNDTTEITSTSGLDNYYGKGDGVFRQYWYYPDTPDTNMELRLFFGFNSGEYYQGVFDPQDTSLYIRKNGSGGYETLATTTNVSDTASGQWYYGDITWYDGSGSRTDGDIDWEVFRYSDDTSLASLSANDTEISDNVGVGIRPYSNGATKVYHDKLWRP